MKKEIEKISKEVNIMEGINFKKGYYRQQKLEKTRRIKEQERKHKESKLKIALTIEILVVSFIIYVLVAQFGELATKGIIYQLTLIYGWLWLFFGQFGMLYYVWVGQYEK